MVKLSRIVKKLIVNNEKSKNVDESKNTSYESFASRGKSQPTIDFGNLPSFEDIKNLKRDLDNAKINILNKRLLKVNKSKEFKTKTKLNHKKYKDKVLDKHNLVDSKVNGQNLSMLHNVGVTTLDYEHNNDNNKNKDNINKKNLKQLLKVNKNQSIMSRGKRKRELKKESWRRKFEFREEAKRIVDKFRKEVKHGKALGNLDDIKDQLENIKENIDLKISMERNKNKNKIRYKAKELIRNRKIFDLTTKNI